MKKILTLAFAVSGILAATLPNTGCVKVDFNENQVIDTTGNKGDGTVPTTLQGRIDNNLYLPKGKYTLRGFVYVGSGATLTFAPGSVILAATDVKTALIVEVGGKLIADGTATEPIVFTSSKAVGQRTPGDWGGISLCGDAPTNRPLNPPPVTEGGSNRTYGGTDANDNSGVLRYVRIEFAGITAENNSELNGLSLYGVGANTVIDYVQTAYCGDDGFEFFGGTVNAKHLFALASGDDDFDFDFGYNGKIQYAVCLRDKSNIDDDRMNAIECDNDGSATNATPLTKPVLSNMTLIGPYDTTGTTGQGIDYGHGNRWRRNTRFVLANSILLGFKRSAVFIENDPTITGYVANESSFLNNLVHSYATNVYESSNQTLLTNAALRSKIEAAGTTTLADQNGAGLTSPFNITNPNFLPATGSPALTGASYTAPDLANAFFAAGAYRGAFGTENWLTGWANFNPQNTAY